MRYLEALVRTFNKVSATGALALEVSRRVVSKAFGQLLDDFLPLFQGDGLQVPQQPLFLLGVGFSLTAGDHLVY